MKTRRSGVILPARLRKAKASKPVEPLVSEAPSERLRLRPAGALPIEIYDPRRIAAFEAEEADLAKILARRKGR
jgi:hypothetical protein